jgi:hypothetical protein
MKTFSRFAFAAVVAIASLTAAADVTVKRAIVGSEYGLAETSTGSKSTSLSVGAIFALSNGVSLEARNITSQSDAVGTRAPGAPVSWQEFAVGYSAPVGFTNVYAKAFYIPTQKNGMRYTANAEEVGVAGLIGSTGLKYQIGYRHLGAFNDAVAYKANNTQVRTTIGYDINKNHSVHLRHTEQKGDLQQTLLNVGYSYAF